MSPVTWNDNLNNLPASWKYDQHNKVYVQMNLFLYCTPTEDSLSDGEINFVQLTATLTLD